MWWLLWSCTNETPPGTTPTGLTNPLLEVAETSSVALPDMDGEAYVVRTTDDVPYVYASTREDLARATGFVVATDRFFMIDMIRRFAEGRLSEVLGDTALSADEESRGIGMARVTDDFLLRLQEDTAWAGVFDAYAEGVNAYVDEVRNGHLPAPSEYVQLGPLLGSPDPADLLVPFTRRDMAAVAATLIFQLGYDSTDVTRADALSELDGLFDGAPSAELRQAGAYDDLFARVEPVWPVSSAPGFGTSVHRSRPEAPHAPRTRPRVEKGALHRLDQRLQGLKRRFGHDGPFGSNAWAVSGAHTKDGRALLAGDGHLPLSVPSLFYQIGLDTELLGGEDLHQVGLALPGFPTLAVGTNGHVAWSQTALYGDISDWYAEQLQLGPDGRPAAALFQGQWRPLVAVDERYVIADVPVLDSVGRTETWTRFETFDGRLVTEIEGRLAADGPPPGPGEAIVDVAGEDVIPSDVDGDGVISAVSFDHAAFDHGNLSLASDGFGHAQDVWEFREATKKNVAYSQNLVAADANGDILYSGYQAVPCRGYLPRNPDGTWVDGADPMLLVDGTTYGGFTIPVNADGSVDESQGATDPYRCVVPFEKYPQNVSPAQGYVVTANNDIGNLATDGSLTNDEYYLGGPWVESFRAHRISERLEEEVAAGTADLDAMQDVQADHRSVVAELWLDDLLDALDRAESLAAGHPAPGSSEERTAALWTANEARFTDARDRLRAWKDRGLWARSGVATFYAEPTPDDVQDAVATTIFHAWMSEVVIDVFDDEGLPDVWYPDEDTGHLRALKRMLLGRGPDNPEGMASWDPATGESVFFDDRTTPEVETSGEILVKALQDGMDAMTAEPTGPGTGGFGTEDTSQWLWGLRHLVKFQSLLAQVMSPDDDFGFLIDLFSITPDVLPLADDMGFGDPRAALPGFPRDGDMVNVDAGDPGFDLDDWSYTHGPVFRMVIALGPDGAEGRNVLPGGQSGLSDSAHFADQAALWLGNDTIPMLTTPDAVTAAATGRITLHP